MEPRRKVPNPLALAILAWLLTEPMHPYELGRRLQYSGKDRRIKYNRGSLYMVVEQLNKAGFVVAQQTVKDGQRPERTVYAITDAGRTEFFDWLRSLVAKPREEYPHFAVALSFLSLLDPDDAVELLRNRQAEMATRTADTEKAVQEALDSGVSWVFLVEEKYAVAMMAAEAAFVTEVIQSLTEPGYVKTWQEIMGSKQ